MRPEPVQISDSVPYKEVTAGLYYKDFAPTKSNPLR